MDTGHVQPDTQDSSRPMSLPNGSENQFSGKQVWPPSWLRREKSFHENVVTTGFLSDLESLIAPMGHDYSKEAVHWKMNSARIIGQTKQVIEAMAKQIAEKESENRFLRDKLGEKIRGEDNGQVERTIDESEAALIALARYVVSRS